MSGEADLAAEARRWRRWLFDEALPLWAEHGRNPAGGFHDTLDGDLQPSTGPMRLRVQARQVYVFAQAEKLGWTGPAEALVRHGLDFLLQNATLDDGLVAHRFAPDGSRLPDPPDLYDQAFALLAYASAFKLLGDERARAAAAKLMTRLAAQRDPYGGYRELPGSDPTLRANPQMHLLEAFLAWRALDPDPVWSEAAAGLAGLCRRKLVDPETDALIEFFDEDWRPAAGDAGRITEPGHHFEWGWLLLQESPEHAALARRLCARAERLGVHRARGAAVNAIDPVGRVLDAEARLWPQCERLRAALALRHDDPAWVRSAVEASQTLARYTAAAGPGLWVDIMEPDGSFRSQPAPASSLYHIVSALTELLGPAGTLGPEPAP